MIKYKRFFKSPFILNTIYNKHPKSLNFLFVISGALLSLLIAEGSGIGLLWSIILMIVILLYGTYKGILSNSIKNSSNLDFFIAIVFDIVFVINVLFNSYNIYYDVLYNLMPLSGSEKYYAIIIFTLVGILSLFSMLIITIFIISYLKITLKKLVINFINSLDIYDKVYIFIFFSLFFLFIIIIYNITNLFYGATHNGEFINFNVVYTTDTTYLVTTNVYLNITAVENDIRQPLFGLFAMPFAIIATVCSIILFFIPNIYPIIICIIQVFLLLLSFLMISKMIGLTKISKMFFLIIITFSYPTLLFSLNMEQYIFATFWLVLFIYAQFYDSNGKAILYIAATGSLITSGILFYLISNKKGLKERIFEIIKVLIMFLVVSISSGRFTLFKNAIAGVKHLLIFTGASIGFKDKILQYINFIASCFVKPNTMIDSISNSWSSYQLSNVNTVNWVGVIIFFMALMGFALNFRHRFAQICMLWLVYSFVLLFLVGWGTVENGLILYSLYFSWAVISLVFMLMEKLTQRIGIIKYFIFATVCILLIFINLTGIWELIKFGIDFYHI